MTMATATLGNSVALLIFLCFLSIAPSFSCFLITTVNFTDCFLPGAGPCSSPAFLPIIVPRNTWCHPKESELGSPEPTLPGPVLNAFMSSLTPTSERPRGVGAVRVPILRKRTSRLGDVQESAQEH